MFLWHLSQSENDTYDTFDSAVVAAETEEEARLINPDCRRADWRKPAVKWCSSPDNVTVNLIGTAVEGTEEGIIIASFNAG